jgi:hypothetical protein
LNVTVCPATVTVPVRGAPVLFAAAVTLTAPLPVPAAPAVIVSQFAFDAALHAHQPPVVTVIDALPPTASTVCVVGAIVYVHAAAAWFTVNGCPAIVIVPDRAASIFALALNATVPLPLPVAPDVTASHGALAAAVHAQLLPVAATVTLPLPPASGIDALGGAIEKLHEGAGGAD